MLALLNRTAYRLHEITASGWIRIGKAENSGNNRMAFVDGGNSSIIKTPAAELQRIRTAAVATENNKLTEAIQREGYLLAKLGSDEAGRIRCKPELTESTLEIGNGDLNGIPCEIAGTGENNASLVKFCETARKLAELKAAHTAARRQKSRFIVLDGTLEAFSETEEKAMGSLFAAAKENSAIVGAVAKTCTLLTDSGKPLLEAVGELGEKEGYLIIAEGLSEKHNAAVAIAKLNSSASYLFRIEAANKDELAQLVAALKEQSNDLSFPGYPYGLIMADRFARISNNEAELSKARIRAAADNKLSNELKNLMRQTKAMDAHDVLDRM